MPINEEIEAKLEEAAANTVRVAQSIETFFALKPFALHRKRDVAQDIDIWAFRLTRPLAPAIAARIGSALHNLRSSLDLVTCAAARSAGYSDRNIFFPMRETAKMSALELAKVVKRLPPSFIAAIGDLAAYAEGNALLWQVHAQNRSDKHTRVVALLESISHSRATTLIVRKGQVLTTGPRAGQHHYRDPRGMTQHIEGHYPKLNLEGKEPFVSYGVDHAEAEALGMDPAEAYTSVPGTVFESDMEPQYTVGFANAFHGESVTSVLDRMTGEVRRAHEHLAAALR